MFCVINFIFASLVQYILYKNMTKAWRKVLLKISMHIRVLHQDFDKKICEFKKKVGNPNFTTVKLQKVCVLDSKWSTRKIHWALYNVNCFGLITQQKRIVTEKDKKLRVKFY